MHNIIKRPKKDKEDRPKTDYCHAEQYPGPHTMGPAKGGTKVGHHSTDQTRDPIRPTMGPLGH